MCVLSGFSQFQVSKMGFRYEDSVESGYASAVQYLVPLRLPDEERQKSLAVLDDIIERCGPVIEAYPSWHPLVCNHDGRHPWTYPCDGNGYVGLDHTRYFAKGFITCPYGDGQDVLDSVAKLNEVLRTNKSGFTLTAVRLDARFYQMNASPILVECHYGDVWFEDGYIPQRVAIPLLLETELPGWRWALRGESWETMRSYFLGSPHGARSSIFVDQETGQGMKRIWNLLITTGMFGPVKY